MIWIVLVIEPVSKQHILWNIIPMNALIKAPHYATLTATGPSVTFHVVTRLSGISHVVFVGCFDVLVTIHITLLDDGPFSKHVIFWLIHPLAILINSSNNWNQSILPSMHHQDVLILHCLWCVQVANKWLSELQDPAFEKLWSLARDVVREHSTITLA